MLSFALSSPRESPLAGRSAFRYRIYPEYTFGIVKWSGLVTADDIIEAMHAFFEADEWQSGFMHLWDGRGIGELVLDVEGAVRIVKHLLPIRRRMGTGRVAQVLRRDFHHFGAQALIAMGEVEYLDLKFFTSMPEACAWLGVPLELAEWPYPPREARNS